MEINDLWDDEDKQVVDSPELDDEGNPIDADPQEEVSEEDEGEVNEDSPKKDNVDYSEEVDDDEEEEEGESEENDGGEDDPKSFLESYLSNFDIVGGMVDVEDGDPKHIDEFEPGEQQKILDQLIEQKTQEATHNIVTPEEQEFLKGIREERPVEDILNELADKKVMAMEANASLGEPLDYERMNSDEIFLKYLREAQPDSTQEELEEDLEIAKQAKTFKNTVDILKGQYSQKQTNERSQFIQAREQERNEKLNQESDRIINSARKIDSIAGWQLTNEDKNSVLANLVERDAKGDSPFMKEIANNPEKLFEAQWYMKNGQKKFEELNNYYKNLVNETYEKGVKEGRSKRGKNPKVSASRTSSKSEENKDTRTTTPSIRKGVAELDDLYNE